MADKHMQVIERRITLRLLAYWEKKRQGRDMPAYGDISKEDIGDLWPHCFLVTRQDMQEDKQFTYLGHELMIAFQGGLLDGKISLVHQAVAEVLNSPKPLINEGQFANSYGETVKYRQCLLPLGEAGEVQAVLGGMRYKIFGQN